jgi:hypothetical protein
MVWLRELTIALLIISLTEPIIVTEEKIFRCRNYLILASFWGFILEMFVRNILLRRIP